jgi:hypothetical protein
VVCANTAPTLAASAKEAAIKMRMEFSSPERVLTRHVGRSVAQGPMPSTAAAVSVNSRLRVNRACAEIQ